MASQQKTKRQAKKKSSSSPRAKKQGGPKKKAKTVKSKAVAKKETAPRKTQSLKTKTASKKENSQKKVPEIPNPTPQMLKCFREVAKKNKNLVKQIEKKRSSKSDFLAKSPRKGRKYSIDLRIHSPGTVGYFSTGGVETGPAVVRLAKVKGLDMIALTDFYNPTNIDEVRPFAKSAGLTILPGVTLRCVLENCHEVYVVALFGEETSAQDLFAILDSLGVPSWAYGRRDYALEIPLKSVISVIENQGGVVIPSRIDKTPYRQLAIPTLVEEYGIHSFDLVHPENTDFFRERWPDGRFTFFSFSNANALAQIGNRAARVKLTQPGFAGIQELVERRV